MNDNLLKKMTFKELQKEWDLQVGKLESNEKESATKKIQLIESQMKNTKRV